MNYFHKGKRNILLWDGQDTGITDKKYEMECPICGGKDTYSIKNLDSFNSCSNELKTYLNEKELVIDKEVKKGIPAYIVKHECTKCNNSIWRIIGLKEIQPQRYNIYYKSTVFETWD